MRKRRSKYVLLAITLFVLLGCVKNNGGIYQVYPRPCAHKAITDPSEVFFKCDDNPNRIESDYYCIDKGHLSQLREYTILMDSLVKKYENTVEEINR